MREYDIISKDWNEWKCKFIYSVWLSYFLGKTNKKIYSRDVLYTNWFNDKWFNEQWIHKNWTKFDEENYDYKWFNEKWFNKGWIHRNWTKFDDNWYNNNWLNISDIHKKHLEKYWIKVDFKENTTKIIRKERETNCRSCKSEINNITFYNCQFCWWIICSCWACLCWYKTTTL